MVAVRRYSWRDKPAVPVTEAAELLGCSTSKVYAEVNRKTLQAVRVAGKVMILTTHIAELLDKAEPWTPHKERVEKANRARLKPRPPSGRPVCELGDGTV
jgi:excisionase family DNA binding protein